MAMMAISTAFSVIMPSVCIDCSGSLLDVPHALLRAVSRLFSTLFEFRNILEVEHRDESRCGTHECVRYVRYKSILFPAYLPDVNAPASLHPPTDFHHPVTYHF